MLIYRKILRDLSEAFSISVVTLNLLIMTESLFRLSRITSGLGLSLKSFLVVILLIQPQALIYTIPLALMVSVLYVYGRMAQDNEILILRMTGLSLARLSYPLSLLTAGLITLSFLLSLYLSPRSLGLLRAEINSYLKNNIKNAIEPGVFITFFKDLTFFIEDIKGNELKNVFIYRQHKDRPFVITAKKGFLLTGSSPSLVLKNGLIHISSTRATDVTFKNYIMKLPLRGELFWRKRTEMSLGELLQQYQKTEKKKFIIEFHRRITFPLVILPMAMFSFSFSLSKRKKLRKGNIVLLGLLVYATYYTLLLYVENLVRVGKVHHLFCWGPIIVFFLITIAVTKSIVHE